MLQNKSYETATVVALSVSCTIKWLVIGRFVMLGWQTPGRDEYSFPVSRLFPCAFTGSFILSWNCEFDPWIPSHLQSVQNSLVSIHFQSNCDGNGAARLVFGSLLWRSRLERWRSFQLHLNAGTNSTTVECDDILALLASNLQWLVSR